MSQDEILTPSEVAGYLRVTEKTLYSLAQRGDLPGFKVGGQWRFRRTAIDAWIDVKTNAAGIEPSQSGPVEQSPIADEGRR